MENLRNAPLDLVLEEARARYAEARPMSRAAHENACRFMPGGNTRTVLYHGPFPLRAERGEGAYLFDADGHRYLNLLGEYTAGLFGHSHPVIMKAIDAAQAVGMNLGAHNLAEAKLAELVTERFPAIEMVRFTNSGTEANLMAVATCCHVTARKKVLVFDGGYHGGLLYFGGGGIPINAPHDFIVAPFNDIERTSRLIAEHGADLACVIVEPMIGSGGCIPADRAFLYMLRAQTIEVGAKLIFDEVMTSRFGAHGAGNLFGVRPDMMTLGKWVGGGMSFGAFGGAAETMALYDPTRSDGLPHAGTFNNNIFSMTAGVAALSEIFPSSEALKLHARGDALRTDINQIFADAGVALSATGMGSLMNFHGVADTVTTPHELVQSNDAAKELLFLDMLERGYYFARRGFIAVSTVVTDGELADFKQALTFAVDARRSALPQRLSSAA
ncbi:MAG: aminotransferase class III-fold pyridoxal phosphate-dependent enzyme [Pseudomonadota bacterium]